jgi:hypothetical protein
MNDDPSDVQSDSFESRIERGLDRLAAAQPVAPHGPFDPNRNGVGDPSGIGRRRAAAWALTAAAAVATVGVGALLVTGQDDDVVRTGAETSAPADEPTVEPTTGPSEPTFTAPPAVTTTTPITTMREPQPSDFAGLIPAECFASSPGTAPSNAVPIRIDLTDVPTPVEATGREIGPIDESIDTGGLSSQRPWTPVSGESAEVIGYVYEPLSELTGPPETMNGECAPEAAIYDEGGMLIGTFIDGSPVLVTTTTDIGVPPEPPETEQRGVTIADIVDAQRQALKNLNGFSATATLTEPGPNGEPTTRTVRYTLVADGSFYADTGPGTFGSYDPTTGIVLGAFRDQDGGLSYQEIAGQSDNSLPLGILGGYDPTMVVQRGFGNPPAIREVTFNGRQAWEVTTEDAYDTDDGVGQVVQRSVQVIDQELGLIVSNETSMIDPDSRRSAALSDIDIVDSMPEAFPGTFPDGAVVQRDGNAATALPATLDDVAEAFGPTVPLPTAFAEGTISENAGPATIIVTNSPTAIGNAAENPETAATYISAEFIVREGFVTTSLTISAQALQTGAVAPDGYAVVDGFLCDDPDGDGRCQDFTATDPNTDTIQAGALQGLAVYIDEQPSYTSGAIVLNGVRISMIGSDRPSMIAAFNGFTR